MIEHMYPENVRAKDAAMIIGVSVSTLAKWRMRKEGPPFKKIGRRIVVYRIKDISMWIEAPPSDLRFS